ncbi:hypothetical protein ACFYVL_07265 [Streptomyces sp. NPDC004111]|uniref:hypothetical protein n=1 Tax=Streptomyces sp. NPDC004111 TaxID=3364690 RepID=UPI0036939E14
MVNTRPGLGALRPGVRAGQPVMKKYRLVNRGAADLYDVRVSDPGLAGARIRCPGGDDHVRMLTGLRTVTCFARAPALAGVWVREVDATGRIPSLRATARAAAMSGYAGVGGSLELTQTAKAGGSARAVVRYALRNTGNRPVYAVRVSDRALPALRMSCGNGLATVARIDPGRSHICTGTARLAPGSYSSAGQAQGSDRIRTLGQYGDQVPPPRLTARASVRFTVPEPPPPQGPAPGSAPPASPPRDPPASAASAAAVPAAPAAPAAGLPVQPAPPAPPEIAVLPDAFALPAEEAAPPEAPAQAAEPDAPAGRPTASDRTTAQQERSAPGRFSRRDQRRERLGVLAALLLVLLPAAAAAAVLGSRKH